MPAYVRKCKHDLRKANIKLSTHRAYYWEFLAWYIQRHLENGREEGNWVDEYGPIYYQETLDCIARVKQAEELYKTALADWEAQKEKTLEEAAEAADEQPEAPARKKLYKECTEEVMDIIDAIKNSRVEEWRSDLEPPSMQGEDVVMQDPESMDADDSMEGGWRKLWRWGKTTSDR